MEGSAQQPEDFSRAFEAAFARLQVALEIVCAAEGPWSARTTLAIHRALQMASADPDGASVLTSEALAQGADGLERYERLMAYIARLLEGGRADSPYGADLPPSTERSLAGGVATIVAGRIERGRQAELPGLTAEIVQFVLTPYLGAEEARRIALAGGWPDGQPDR